MNSHIPIGGYSEVRQSKVITNQETIANESEMVTVNNNRFKRTVYHTPAIIQTVVDTPQPNPTILPVRYQTITAPRPSPFGAAVHDAVLTTTRSPRIGNALSTVDSDIGYGRYDREVGVKVYEDLSSLRPVKTMQAKKPGMGGKAVGFCWGRNCPLWVCCLIPLLTILLLFGLSFCIARRKMPIIGDTTPLQNEVPQNDIVQPLVSTDMPTGGTRVPFDNEANLQPVNQATRPHIDPSYQVPSYNNNVQAVPYQPDPLDIYSRVKQLRQRNQPQPANQHPRMPIIPPTAPSRFPEQGNLYGARPQEPLSPYPEKFPVSRRETTVNGIRQAPTIEQVLTKSMIEADLAKKAETSSDRPFRDRISHLRHSIN